MPAAPLHWPAEALWEQLEALLPGLSVEVVAETDSTNTRLLERARAGDAAPCLMVAEHQRAGRGRLGRDWSSRAGASLTFSLGLPLAPRDWSGLSLAVGVAVAEALHPAIRLKWPNDLWLVDAQGAGRKLGGILIETLLPPAGSAPQAARPAVIGIGLNILAVDDPALAAQSAALVELDPAASAPAALAALAAPLVRALQRFEREGFAPFVEAYAARDLLRGRAVRTTQADVPEGVACGVDVDGTLLVRTETGVQRVSSGEVSVRPC
ncbi:biotin--[acetyl-CoA-carboxylase] ligase [Caldimonas tepidiphila]|uniref:biotin--[acetyl-CoA-carboxylase] ligase n=1 Tax=Caldimonas tepidiphila TaxID=2315841 RepID=UPI00196A2B06|nr:biotin--[acetyl-CoA-carboxylase] ligase [Caldimonas tepidiphila]